MRTFREILETDNELTKEEQHYVKNILDLIEEDNIKLARKFLGESDGALSGYFYNILVARPTLEQLRNGWKVAHSEAFSEWSKKMRELLEKLVDKK